MLLQAAITCQFVLSFLFTSFRLLATLAEGDIMRDKSNEAVTRFTFMFAC